MSPPVVMVRTPVMNVVFSTVGFGIGSAFQRIWAIGTGGASSGAERQYAARSVGLPGSVATGLKWPQWATLGRIRNSKDRSLLARGGVNGAPLSCAAERP